MIHDLVRSALAERSTLLTVLHGEATDCYRLFHGSCEGRPGTTIDRYGDIGLVQTWREPMSDEELAAVDRAVVEALGIQLRWVRNDRAKRGDVRLEAKGGSADVGERILGREMGLKYDVRPRHDGIDPLLFLDFRAGRRRVRAEAGGRSVLNLFAYTCGIGVAAASGGARSVLNVDFAARSLAVGQFNADLNGFDDEVFQCLQEDCQPIMRQLAGLGVKGRAAKRPYTRVEPQLFDLVILDPPRYAKSPFGLVDTVGDYPSLFKPALLSTTPGGHMLVTNNVASVEREEWLALLMRAAEKAERPIHGHGFIEPESDFPSPDGHPPLKMAWLSV